MSNIDPVHLPSGNLGNALEATQVLPDPLPEEPLGTLAAWIALSREHGLTPNPNAMCVGTIDPDGRPSARIVLCRKIMPAGDADSGGASFIVFYTNRESRKGVAIASHEDVSVVVHLDHLDRQVRLEGVAVVSPEWESDEYFASRSVAKRIGAWASDQSRPIESRAALEARVGEVQREYGVEDAQLELTEGADALVPRPPHWGGYRIFPRAVELWMGQRSRIHDRVRYERRLEVAGGVVTVGGWSTQRLQP